MKKRCECIGYPCDLHDKPKRETYRCTGELRLQGGGERTWIRCDLKSVHSGDHSNYAGYAWPRAACGCGASTDD